MQQLAANAPNHWIRCELVRTAVNTDLVRPTMPRNCDVFTQRGFELLEVALVIDALFKIANEPRRDADNVRHLVPLQFGADEEMLHRTRRLIGFVYANLDLKGAPRHGLGYVAAHEA